MNAKQLYMRVVAVLAVTAGLAMGLAACTEHVQEPWVAEGTMQDERHVAPTNAEVLDTRLLVGQSDR